MTPAPWTGLPPDPTVSGWHWLRLKGGSNPIPVRWAALLSRWFYVASAESEAPTVTAARMVYVGACVAPSEPTSNPDPVIDVDCVALIERADKETLWWSLYKVLDALAHARACDPNCIGKEDNRGGLYTIAHMTADHWGTQIPGMPDPVKVRRAVVEDISHHERTYAAERRGQRVTGDEFI